MERDAGRCRVAAFLPDQPCAGGLDVYDPADLTNYDPESARAVTVCDAHLAWIRANPSTAAALGLARL